MRLPPIVHSARDKNGYMPTLIALARTNGVSAYVGDGANRWAAGHTLDAGHYFQGAATRSWNATAAAGGVTRRRRGARRTTSGGGNGMRVRPT